jgi:hypothetical protein
MSADLFQCDYQAFKAELSHLQAREDAQARAENRKPVDLAAQAAMTRAERRLKWLQPRKQVLAEFAQVARKLKDCK